MVSARRLIRTAVLVSCAGVSVLLACQHVLHYASNPKLLFELDAATGLHEFMRITLITAAAVVVALPAVTLGLAVLERSQRGSHRANAGLSHLSPGIPAAAAGQEGSIGSASSTWHQGTAASPSASHTSASTRTARQGVGWWERQQQSRLLLLLYVAWNAALLLGPLFCVNRSDLVWGKQLPARYQNPPNAARWVYAVGAAAAWPLVGNMALALLLASRSSQLLFLMGVADYRCNLWLHKTAGVAAFGWTCVHGVFTQLPVMVVHYATFAWLFWDPTNNFGFRAACANAAWGAFILMAAAALPPVRRLSFGTFKSAHLLLWPVIVLGTMHMSSTFSWLLLPVILYLADVGLRNTLHYSQTVATVRLAPVASLKIPSPAHTAAAAAAAAAAEASPQQVHLKQGGVVLSRIRTVVPHTALQRSSSYSTLSSPRKRASLAGLSTAAAARGAAAAGGGQGGFDGTTEQGNSGTCTNTCSRTTTCCGSTSGKKLDTSLVVVSIPTGDLFAFKAATSLQGACVLLQVPAVSHWEWHPFSIACVTDTHMYCVIKARGDWTQRLAALGGVTEGAQLSVALEGPYGAPLSTKVAQQLAAGHTVLLAAGGVGITTMLQVLQAAAGSSAGMGANHPAGCVDWSRLHLVWVVRTSQEPDLLLHMLEAAAHSGVLISIYMTSAAKLGHDMRLCPAGIVPSSSYRSMCLPAAVCASSQAQGGSPQHVVWPILLRGLVLWAAAVGAIGGYMMGPALCSVGTLELEPTVVHMMESAYEGRVAHNYGLALGYNTTRLQLLPNGTWPAGQKRFSDAKLYACSRLGGSEDWVMWRDNLAGWKYGQPAPVTDMSCWACPPVVRLLLCFLFSVLAAISTGGTIRWFFQVRQYMKQQRQVADQKTSCHNSRDGASTWHSSSIFYKSSSSSHRSSSSSSSSSPSHSSISTNSVQGTSHSSSSPSHSSSISTNSVQGTSDCSSSWGSTTTSTPSRPVPGRAYRGVAQMADGPSQEPGDCQSLGGIQCYAGRPCWATCLRGFLYGTDGSPLGYPTSGDLGGAPANIPTSDIPSRQLGVPQQRQGFAAAGAAREVQQGGAAAAAYQVYVCGPDSMAAAVRRALDQVRPSSRDPAPAPVLLHNINQSL